MLRLDHWTAVLLPQSPTIDLDAFLQDAMAAMELWESSLLSTMNTNKTLQELPQWYQDNKGSCGFDGSVEDGKASSGWKLVDRNGHTIAQCSSSAPGRQPNSFRAESYGYLSFVRFLLLLERDDTITAPKGQLIHTTATACARGLRNTNHK
jgi:hypothetical protein